AVPLCPLFYYFGQRPNPTRDEYILPGYWRAAGQIAEAAAALERAAPKLFIYCDVPLDARAERRFSETSPALYDYFMRRYARMDRIACPIAGLDVNFTMFRRVRPAARWPALEAASRALSPAGAHGPVFLGPLERPGGPVAGWKLGAGGSVEIQI